MASPEDKPEGFGQRHGVTILTLMLVALIILVCIVQVRT